MQVELTYWVREGQGRDQDRSRDAETQLVSLLINRMSNITFLQSIDQAQEDEYLSIDR